jgi:hypothetical protein
MRLTPDPEVVEIADVYSVLMGTNDIERPQYSRLLTLRAAAVVAAPRSVNGGKMDP